MNTLIYSVKQLFPPELHDRIFLVGGCVRDLLLERAGRDVDLVCALTPAEISSCGFQMITGKTTAPLWLRHHTPSGPIEATLIQNMQDLHTDLVRRDFTINAMAMNLNGEIIDPLHGREDLEQGRLRACSSETFSADPLRLFRALRFEADLWKITCETKLLLGENEWETVLAEIPVERFSREMLKALELQNPGRFVQRMLDFNIGLNYLPELFRMPQIPAGPLVHHPEGDLFTHSIQVLQRVAAMSDDPLTRFCALFHDLGKLATSPALYPKHHGHDQKGFKPAMDFCRRLRLPAHYGTALAWVSKLHTTFNLWDQLRIGTKLRMAEQAIKAGIVDILPLVAAADKAGTLEPVQWRRTVEIASLSATSLDIDLDKLSLIATNKRADFILQAKIKILNGSTVSG
jgi:tRNA nucleotidyltransferase (CCA-adding enzyme)